MSSFIHQAWCCVYRNTGYLTMKQNISPNIFYSMRQLLSVWMTMTLCHLSTSHEDVLVMPPSGTVKSHQMSQSFRKGAIA